MVFNSLQDFHSLCLLYLEFSHLNKYTGGQVIPYRQFFAKRFELLPWNHSRFWNKQYLIWKTYYRASRISHERGCGGIIWAAIPSWIKKHHICKKWSVSWQIWGIPIFVTNLLYHVLGLSFDICKVFLGQGAQKWRLVKVQIA